MVMGRRINCDLSSDVLKGKVTRKSCGLDLIGKRIDNLNIDLVYKW